MASRLVTATRACMGSQARERAGCSPQCETRRAAPHQQALADGEHGLAASLLLHRAHTDHDARQRARVAILVREPGSLRAIGSCSWHRGPATVSVQHEPRAWVNAEDSNAGHHAQSSSRDMSKAGNCMLRLVRAAPCMLTQLSGTAGVA